MTAPVIDESIVRFITGWDSAYAARAVIGVLGLVIGILTARVVWRRQSTVVAGVLWLLAAAAMVAFAVAPQPIVNAIITTEYVRRLRIIMAGLSVFVLLITLESIRVTRLQERYALLWVATALVILAAAAFPQAVNVLRAVLGMQYVEAVVALAFTFLVLLAFHFSISVSALQSKLEKTAQRNAILDARVAELEKRLERLDNAGRKPNGG